MGLFSKNKKPQMNGCATVEDFFRLHTADSLSGMLYSLLKIRCHRNDCKQVSIYGKQGYASDYRFYVTTRGIDYSWADLKYSLEYQVPKNLKHIKPNAVDILKVLTERVADGEKESNPFYALQLGLMYEYGIGDGVSVDKESAERCYYIAEQGGIKYMPIIRHLQQYNCITFKEFKDSEENLFASLLPPVLKTITAPEIKPEIDRLSSEDYEQIQEIATLGMCHCCSKGYPFSRLMIMGALANKDDLIGKGKYFTSDLSYASYLKVNDISEAKLWTYYESISGNSCASAACRWFNVSFS